MDQSMDYFYCYNKKLSDFLRSRGINYIHIAIEPKSNKLFSLYPINDTLQAAIQEYKQSK